MVVWSTIEASCPICKNRLRLREVGSGFALGQDSDLFVRMKGKHIIQAEVHTCHKCRYSGFTQDFLRDVSSEERLCFLRDVAPQLVDEEESTPGSPRGGDGADSEEHLKNVQLRDSAESKSLVEGSRKGPKKAKKGLARKGKRLQPARRSKPPLPLVPCGRTPLPHVQYYWAAKTAAALGLGPHDQAQRVLRAYWCLRIAPSSKLAERVLKRLRKRYLTEAIRKFRQGLRHEKDPHIVYLVAELCRRNGNFLLATGYFRRFFEKGKEARRYLRQASQKLHLVAKEKLATELSMEEVLYDPAPEPHDEE